MCLLPFRLCKKHWFNFVNQLFFLHYRGCFYLFLHFVNVFFFHEVFLCIDIQCSTFSVMFYAQSKINFNNIVKKLAFNICLVFEMTLSLVCWASVVKIELSPLSHCQGRNILNCIPVIIGGNSASVKISYGMIANETTPHNRTH